MVCHQVWGQRDIHQDLSKTSGLRIDVNDRQTFLTGLGAERHFKIFERVVGLRLVVEHGQNLCATC